MDGTRPLMLGLVGDSAAGKTTLVRGVVRLLGHNGVTPISLDDYHRFSRADLVAQGLTAADPAANNLELMAEHLATLRAGGSIRKPVYDHRSGTLRGPETVAATGLVIAYGMLTLTPPSLAALFDLTVYLEPDQAMRQAWRLERDVRERGYSAEQVAAREADRERDAARFVVVQRPRADLLVRFHGAPDADPTRLAVELIIRRNGSQGALAPALDSLAEAGLPGLALTPEITDDDGCLADRLVIEADISPAAAAAAATLIGDGLSLPRPLDFAALGQIRGPASTQHSRSLALTQLLIVRRLAAAG